MAFSSRKSWDLTHLSSKYPWLRVDAETIEEFRSPFQWVDAPPKPKPARPQYQQQHSANDSGDEEGNGSGQSDGEERKESVRFSLSGRKVTESSAKNKKHKPLQYTHERWKKPQQRHIHPAGTEKSAAHGAKHAQALSTAFKPVDSDQRILVLPDTQSTQTNDSSALHRIPSIREKATASSPQLLALLETDALYQAITHPVQRKPKKKKVRKKTHNILSLSFPVLSKPTQGKASSNNIHQSNVLAIHYSKQLKDLAQAEQKLKSTVYLPAFLQKQVSSQIEAEKAKLPLAFLFERNLDRTYCKEKSIATITAIFTKLQHRLMFASFERWCNFVHGLQREERKDAAFKRSQVQALAFFEKLASDAYVGTLDRAFTRWKDTAHNIVRFRQRRAKELLRGLKQASLDKEFKRKVEIQQLLRFEAYGKAMQWSTLRNGFNLLLQNHCARRIQFFFRRVMVQKRIMKRIVRREAAIMIQKPWRGKLARRELAHRKELFIIRQALEHSAAIQIQKHARSYLARQEVRRRREWLSNENQRALEIQICWRKYRERRELHRRFALRKLLLDAEKERLSQLEREKELEKLEMMHNAAALDIERVYRGFQGRQAFKVKLYERDLELAARRVQTSWRKSKGRYVLQLRFSAQRDRIEAWKQEAALQIQCCYQVFRAKQTLRTLRANLRQRQRAATNIQRVYRGHRERSQYQRTRRATITIQGGMKCKLARRERQRRLDKKVAEFKEMTEAATQLQKWIRGVLGRMVVRRMRELRAREEQLTKSAALLIQKRARGIEAQKIANLLREAMKMVDLQQKRHFQGSQRDASALLEFMTKYYLNRAPATENGGEIGDENSENSENGENGGGDRAHFTYEQSVWLQERIQEAKLQIVKEDKAIVFLQRMYRGFVARVDFVVRKLRAKQRRELEIKMAIVIQKHARGSLARQRVKKLRYKRKMGEIKDAYVRERKWKVDEQKWKEQYQREQMELQIRKVKAMELKLREAKRDAELAKWRAEEAAFKKQELMAQQEFDKQERARRRLAKTNGEEELEEVEEEGWTEMVDAYGNAYFYNEARSESSWERPMKRLVKPTVTLESSKNESQKDKKKLQVDGSSKFESAEVPAKAEKLSVAAATDGQDKGEAMVPEGNCWKCRVSLATKECLDCSDDTRRKFCGSCFMSEHYSLPAESGDSRQKHDFRVLVKVKNRSQCQSLACCSRESGRANLATYYCGECSVILKPTGTSVSQESSKGCFYCEECFPRAHESAQELQHVPSALHFRTGALLCCDCGSLIGTRQCEQCDEAFCSACFEQIHAQSQKKREHAWTSIELLKEELSDSGKDAYCIECDLRRATRLCNLCGDGFCDLCFTVAHEKGKKQQHTWISWETFSQVGDWLEIFDEKAQAKIFFNIETKESTTKQPFVLKPGAERHLLQFQEREQLQKRKELELESEIVSLKEKLKEIAEKEVLAQRPLSRNLRSSGGNRPDSTGNTAAVEPPKEKKKGMLGKLLSMKTRAAANGKANDGLTPEERKKQELRKGIKGEEQALVMSKLKTRAREEKEAKAAQTLGTKQFESSILQELAS